MPTLSPESVILNVLPTPDLLRRSVLPPAEPPRKPPFPTPDRTPSFGREMDQSVWVDLYIRSRAKTLKQTLSPQEHAAQTANLGKIVSILTPDNAAQFFKNPYAAENLEYFFSIDPKKIDLALQVASDIKRLSLIQELNPQFIPALNLGAFVSLEMIKDSELVRLEAHQIQRILKLKRGQRSQNWGQDALLRHTIDNLSKVAPNLQGRELEKQLTTTIALDLHQKLTARTEEMQWLGQSQGVEVEVLKYITRSKRAAEKGVDPKWLPRGIPLEQHARRDWNLLPLLGVKEDVGERASQVYEMSTHPTDTMATQTTIMFELMLGGFITENMLSDDQRNNARRGKEAYSLHVSTVFPQAIITRGSMREYKDMARCLAGAFASDQRIAFGGFMSGGEEVANKSASGNLVEVGKRTLQDGSIPRNLALIEIRNLDLTLRDQYPVLLQKEILDYSFRCAWEKNTHPHLKLSQVDEFAARQWKSYSTELQQLYRVYGISTEQLYKKYGSKWETYAWKDMADAREKNPQLKQQLALLVRKHTSQVRGYKKQVERRGEAESGHALESIRYLTVEPQGQQSDRVYLSADERKRFGVKPGDTLTIRCGNKTKPVTIAPAKIRGDGTTEAIQESPFRVSSNLLQEFQLPNGYAMFPMYDTAKKELALKPIDAADSPIIKIRETRKLLTEPKGLMPDRFYMSPEDRQRLDLRPGQEIYIRFGEIRKKILVAAAKQRDNGTTESAQAGNWRVSANVLEEFGIPDGIPLRTRYDKSTHEFSFGPSLAHLNHIEDLGQGNIKVQGGETFFRQAAKQATGYGAFICLVDINRQNPDVIRSGSVDAYIPDEKKVGKWKKVRIPIPEVAYDKDITPKTETGKQLIDKFQFEITPGQQQALTKDKLQFAKMFEKSALATYHPDTIAMSDADSLDKFLTKHGNIIIKPRFGQQGKGIITVERDSQGYIIRGTTIDKDKQTVLIESRAKTAAEVLAQTQKIRGERQYIAQKRIDLAKYSFQHHGVTHTRVPEIRLTIQRGIDGQPRITGMIARLHDPKLEGKEYLEQPSKTLSRIFPQNAEGVLSDVRSLGISALRLFEGKIGKLSGEITFDIGIEADGAPIVIEANSKAETRAMYMDPALNNQDAAYHSTARPLEYALYLTDMN